MRNGRQAAALILSLVVILVFIAGCGGEKEPQVQPVEEQTPVPAEPTETTEPSDPEEVPTEEPNEDPELSDPNRDWEPIETPFGRLRYPDQFFDYLETEQQESENGLRVLFSAVIGEKKIQLFELLIGEGDGEPVGSLTGPDDVQRDVFLRFIEIEDTEGLTEGETNRVYAMQESLNFVIDNLR